MNTRCVVAICCALLSSGTLGSQARAPRPNIVYILADDLGYADVGFNGGREIATPRIDRLAASGARLELFYVQTVCSPTRAALMTGRYPMRHGLQVGVVRPWAQYGLPLEERTLAQALKQAGYATAIMGKWHLGHFEPAYLPTKRGFDIQYGQYNGAIDYFTHERDGGHGRLRGAKGTLYEGGVRGRGERRLAAAHQAWHGRHAAAAHGGLVSDARTTGRRFARTKTSA